jgi:hypothetical protein
MTSAPPSMRVGATAAQIGDRGMDPLRLVPVSHDAVRAHHLVSVENPAFASVAKVFAYLASKIASMKQEAQKEFFPMLLMFGERVGSSDMAPEGEVQVSALRWRPPKLSTQNLAQTG